MADVLVKAEILRMLELLSAPSELLPVLEKNGAQFDEEIRCNACVRDGI